MNKMSWPKKIFIYSFLVFFSTLFLFPYFWTITSAFKSASELNAYPPVWIPTKWHFENFYNAWTSQPFTRYLINSVIIVIGTTMGQVVSCSLVAYGFARFKFKGRDTLFIILLATMMIPWDVTMIPLYMQFNFLGWINTLKPLIIPSWFGSPFYIFMLRQFLMGIPKDIEEAAMIDGANPFQIYLRIIMPLIKPALVLIGVFNTLAVWNDYLGPLIFLNDNAKYTLTLGLAQFKGIGGDIKMAAIMAVTTIICIPPTIAFFFAQKQIVDGITQTGIK
ncbi:carbohydrate ABC transporter permease [Alkaliphilus peptidifermentans]|uniref:Multiple sugar transport system permease protein n=1 Tax=Alkaliphilus peptidifermentans DSM 18978 TaxID=1120976 RepID=A0A1G5L5R0_9FIRM|nr:carbohydrate ABC transporter permease [Alkaliphilus peptidifermentans]SCZ08205.1 multiple sugar transport system permease protein [Alkaliphilus peptidifermentans DSM 18978]